MILPNIAVFCVAFYASLHFVSKTIESDQDPSQVKLSRYVFSSTFALCILMLILFLQEVWQMFDSDTSMTLWRTLFVVMTIKLLVVIPLALARDFLCA